MEKISLNLVLAAKSTNGGTIPQSKLKTFIRQYLHENDITDELLQVGRVINEELEGKNYTYSILVERIENEQQYDRLVKIYDMTLLTDIILVLSLTESVKLYYYFPYFRDFPQSQILERVCKNVKLSEIDVLEFANVARFLSSVGYEQSLDINPFMAVVIVLISNVEGSLHCSLSDVKISNLEKPVNTYTSSQMQITIKSAGDKITEAVVATSFENIKYRSNIKLRASTSKGVVFSYSNAYVDIYNNKIALYYNEGNIKAGCSIELKDHSILLSLEDEGIIKFSSRVRSGVEYESQIDAKYCKSVYDFMQYYMVEVKNVNLVVPSWFKEISLSSVPVL